MGRAKYEIVIWGVVQDSHSGACQVSHISPYVFTSNLIIPFHDFTYYYSVVVRVCCWCSYLARILPSVSSLLIVPDCYLTRRQEGTSCTWRGSMLPC